MFRKILLIFISFLSLSLSAVNSAPTNILLSSSSFNENVSLATVIGSFSTTDVDIADIHTYTLVPGVGATHNASFSISGNQLITNALFDFEALSAYSIRVQSNDGNGGTFEKIFAITVSDLNDVPVLNVPGGQVVNEFTNISITPLSVSDDDVGSDSLMLSLSVVHGVISLNSTAGLRFITGDGSADYTMSFKAKLASINLAISSVVYKSVDDYVGTDVLSITVNDLGNNGAGGAKFSTQNINITVNAVPVVFVTQPVNASVCETRSHFFYVSTTGTNNMTYQWQKNLVNIPGANNDTLLISNAVWADGAAYRCVVTNPAGTFSSSSVNLVVNGTPIPSFTYNEVCAGSTTTFNNTTTINFHIISSYTWDFDDNNATSILEDPTRVFSSDGSFDVRLIATGNTGCSDTLIQTIVVNPYPQTNFVVGDICFVDSLRPQNTTTINTGTVSSLWTFGDGSTSIKKNPAHKYVSTDTYILTLQSTSNKGCSTSKTQSVTVNPSPIANFVVPDICDSTEAKFQGVSSISSGTIVYSWNFGDGDTAYNQVNLKHLYVGANTYPVKLKVVSDKWCSDSVVKNIQVFPNPTLNINITDVACYAGITGVISAESSNGLAPYFYSLNYGTYTLDPVFKRLPAGNYHLKVLDYRNCLTERDIRVKEPDLLKVDILNIEHVKCFGAQTGAYTISPQGGTPPYYYYVNKQNQDTALTSYTFSDTGYVFNLKARNYLNCLVDNNGCRTRFMVDVSQPTALSFSTQHDNVSCKGFNDGEITVLASGGAGSYSYSKNGGANYQWSNMFKNLNAHDYLISVKDTNGCGVSANVNVIEPLLELKTIATVDMNVACKGDSSAQVSLSSVGGTGVVKYALANKNSFGISYRYTHLPKGNHVFYAQDENTCLDSTLVTITEPLSSVAIQNINVNHVKCFGNNDASLYVTAIGGTGNLKYSIANYFQNSSTFSNLGAATYLLTVKDANACIDTTSIVVTQPNKLVLNAVSLGGVNCKNDIAGSVDFNISGGTTPFTYFVGDTIRNSSPVMFVAGGSHFCKVIDANGCVVDTNVQIPFVYDVVKIDFQPFVAGKVITFNNNTSNAASYQWSFGDGDTSSSFNPIHLYPSNGIYNIKLKATNQCNSDSLIKQVNIGSVGIYDIQNDLMFLYPNPCSNELNINFSVFSEEVKVEVIDMLGTLVFSSPKNSDIMTISTSNLASGKYLLRIYNNGINEIKSFEVIH